MKKIVLTIALLALISAGAAVKAGNPLSDLPKPVRKTIAFHGPEVNPFILNKEHPVKYIPRLVHPRPRDNNK